MEDYSLGEKEEVVCKAEMAKPLTFFLIFGLFFGGIPLAVLIFSLLSIEDIALIIIMPVFMGIFIVIGTAFVVKYFKSIIVSKNISLILTNERIFIYVKQNGGYANFYFKDIKNWSHYNANATMNGHPIFNAKFTFIVSNERYVAFGIKNYYQMYQALFSMMPSNCTNPMSHSFSGNVNFERPHKTYNIVISKIRFNKYEIMQLIKKYTNDDISQIDEKLKNLPCIIMSGITGADADAIIEELEEIGCEAYKYS